MTFLFVPRIPTPPAPPRGAYRAVLSWPTTGYLLVTLLAFCAIFVVIGFVRPVVSSLTGFDGRGVGMVQMISGLGSFLGLVIGTRMVERGAASPLVWLFFSIVLSQTVFAVALIGGWSGSAGLAASLAFALNSSMVYLGQGLGVVLGGTMLTVVGLSYISTAGMAVATVGVLLALRLRARRDLPLPVQ